MTAVSPEEIIARGDRLYDTLNDCHLCPMDCGANRLAGETGNCGAGAVTRVASHNLHFGEEPPLSGGGGSGTIFLSHCPLNCRYCQNYPISQYGNGADATVRELGEMMLKLQSRGVDNINFVTPDHMLPMILQALGRARLDGLCLPIVFNCSGYEKVEILKELEGIIDIYLVDMRYNDDQIALKYSGCKDYVKTNRAAIREMYRQVGNLRLDDRELAVSGVMVRHLVLPGGLSGSEGIFEFLGGEISRGIYISLMSQYFPAYKAADDPTLNRRITPNEFRVAVDAFNEAGLHNGYIQEMIHEQI